MSQDQDDSTHVRRLLETLRSDSPPPPRGLASRVVRRVHLDVFMRDVVDFVALRFLQRRERTDEHEERDE